MEEILNEAQTVQTERFQFVLSINDYIICQRYFKIGGFKNRAIESVDLIDAGNKCVQMIKNDLKEKTQTYYQHSAPQIFQNEEEMYAFLERERQEGYLSYSPTTFPVASFIILRDSPNVYVWDGNDVTLYEGKFNRADYLADNVESIIRFEFLVDNKPVFIESFDASVYPRFVRNNIDLSNQKNRYRSKETFSIVEATLVDIMNQGRKDLIYPIIAELSKACSYRNADNYTTVLTGWRDANGKDYETDITRQNLKWMRKVETQYQKKKALSKKKATSETNK